MKVIILILLVTKPGAKAKGIGTPLDPTPCSLSRWSTWGVCSKSCGGGVQSRDRKVVHEANNGGEECQSERNQEQQCLKDTCPPIAIPYLLSAGGDIEHEKQDLLVNDNILDRQNIVKDFDRIKKPIKPVKPNKNKPGKKPQTGNVVSPPHDANGTATLYIPCVPGLRKFASSAGLGYYYECQPGKKYPIQKQCPDNQLWNRETLFCETKRNQRNQRNQGNGDDKEPENKRSMPYIEQVLGRTVMLGDLYDSRNEQALNGYSLWDQKKIQEEKLTKDKYYSNTHFFAEQNQKDRLDIFDVDASLSLSFYAGLIKVDGSAHYLSDSRESSNTVRFNMIYYANTRTETLPMSMRRKITYNEECKKISDQKNSGPTHVITSIEYGMRAVFVFQIEASSKQEAEEISGSLRVVVKKIPGLEISGEASLKLTEQENQTISKIQVQLFGDFILEDNPTTYEAALSTYRNISHHLGDEENKYNKSSPIRIMLTPVDQICDDMNILLATISADMTTLASKMMAEIDELMVYVNTVMNTYVAQTFIDVSQMIGYFHTNLTIFKTEQGIALKDILPAIRAGGGDEHLFKLYVNYTNSAYSYYRALRFLTETERELNTISFLFQDQSTVLGDIQIGDFALANINHAIIYKPYVIIYWFKVLSDVNVTKEYIENPTKYFTAVGDKWYNNMTTVGEAGYKWRHFRDFAIRNKNFFDDQVFFIKGDKLDDSTELSSVSVYENGIIKANNFKIPTSPPPPKFQSRNGSSVILILGNYSIIKDDTENEFVSKIFVNYRFSYKLSGTEIQYENQNETFNMKDHIDEAGNILVSVYMPPHIQIGATTTTKSSSNTKSTTTLKPDHTTKSTTNTKTVTVTYTVFSAYQTPFGRGPHSDPLEVPKHVAEDLVSCEISLCPSSHGCSVIKNNLLITLPELNKEFYISFEFKAIEYIRGWQNIIHFTKGENFGDGNRIPAIFIDGTDGVLYPCFSVNGNGDYCFKTKKKYPKGQWHHVEFSQTLTKGKYMYQVKINGESLKEVENSQPKIFSDVKVYVSDNWYHSMKGSIRNLFINTKKSDKCLEARQWSEIQAKIWGDDQCKCIGEGSKLGLEDCKKKCLETATCTAINYNTVSKFCVLRGCIQPVQTPQWQHGNFRGYYMLPQNDPCPNGWTWLRTGCYRFLPESGNLIGNIEDAIAICENEGGYLVEINSQEEQDALHKFNNDQQNGEDVWLGARYSAKNGDWRWIHSGQAMNFSAWNKGEPNNLPEEDCLMTVQGFKWNNRMDSGHPALKALCEYSGASNGRR